MGYLDKIEKGADDISEWLSSIYYTISMGNVDIDMLRNFYDGISKATNLIYEGLIEAPVTKSKVKKTKGAITDIEFLDGKVKVQLLDDDRIVGETWVDLNNLRYPVVDNMMGEMLRYVDEVPEIVGIAQNYVNNYSEPYYASTKKSKSVKKNYDDDIYGLIEDFIVEFDESEYGQNLYVKDFNKYAIMMNLLTDAQVYAGELDYYDAKGLLEEFIDKSDGEMDVSKLESALYFINQVYDASTKKMKKEFNILDGDDTFRYQMLDRLRTDMDYYYGNGNRHDSCLWAGDFDTQILYMKRLWNSFDEKPEWLTMEQIEEYENRKNSSTKKSKVNKTEVRKMNVTEIEVNGEPYYIWQHFDDFKGSREHPDQFITNARAVLDFKRANGFNSIQDVIDYINRYFVKSTKKSNCAMSFEDNVNKLRKSNYAKTGNINQVKKV